MNIVQYPDPILTTKTEHVVDFAEAQEISLKLRATIRMDGGLIGLAAPQIGISKAVCVVGLESEEFITMVNPLITDSGGSNLTETEGCGSMREPRLLVNVT